MNNTIANNEAALTSYYKNLLEKQEKASQDRMKALEASYDQKLDRVMDLHQKEAAHADALLRETVDEITEKNLQNIRSEKDAFLKEIENQKNYNYDSRGKMPMMSEKSHHEHLKEVQDAYEKRRDMDHAEIKALEKEKNENIKALSDQSKEQMVHLGHTFKQNMSNLEDQVRQREKIAHREVLQKELEKKEAIADQENANKDRLNHLNAGFNQELSKLKDNLESKAAYYESRQKNALQDQAEKFEGIFSKEKKEQKDLVHQLQQDYAHQMEVMQTDVAHDKALLEQQMKKKNEEAEMNKQDALRRQEEANQRTIQHMEKNRAEQAEHLEKGIQKAQANRLVDVSADVEQKIRTGVIQEYEKALQIELKRNKDQVESLTNNVKEPMLEMQRKNAEKEAQFHLAAAQERFEAKNQIMDLMYDSEAIMAQKLKDQEINTEKQKNVIVRYFERLLERQKHDFSNMLQDLQNRSDQRILELQKDQQFSTKELRRGFIEQQNDIIRDYERRLSDQKIEFDDHLDQLQMKKFDDLKDLERKDKHDLENTIKTYEQRIAQLEAQFKEREKIIYQGFQDEMNRTKQSYEAARKKG